MMPIPEFDDFEDAFSYVREKNHPCNVSVDHDRWKLYPSGRAEKIVASTTFVGVSNRKPHVSRVPCFCGCSRKVSPLRERSPNTPFATQGCALAWGLAMTEQLKYCSIHDSWDEVCPCCKAEGDA